MVDYALLDSWNSVPVGLGFSLSDIDISSSQYLLFQKRALKVMKIAEYLYQNRYSAAAHNYIMKTLRASPRDEFNGFILLGEKLEKEGDCRLFDAITEKNWILSENLIDNNIGLWGIETSQSQNNRKLQEIMVWNQKKKHYKGSLGFSHYDLGKRGALIKKRQRRFRRTDKNLSINYPLRSSIRKFTIEPSTILEALLMNDAPTSLIQKFLMKTTLKLREQEVLKIIQLLLERSRRTHEDLSKDFVKLCFKGADVRKNVGQAYIPLRIFEVCFAPFYSLQLSFDIFDTLLKQLDYPSSDSFWQIKLRLKNTLIFENNQKVWGRRFCLAYFGYSNTPLPKYLNPYQLLLLLASSKSRVGMNSKLKLLLDDHLKVLKDMLVDEAELDKQWMI